MAYKVQAYAAKGGWADVIRLAEPDSSTVRLHTFPTVDAAIDAWEKQRRGWNYEAPKLPANWKKKAVVLGNRYRIVDVDTDEVMCTRE